MLSDRDMQDVIDERALRDPTIRELSKILKIKGYNLHAGFLLDGWLTQLESMRLAIDAGLLDESRDAPG